MTEKNTTITVHTREIMVLRNFDALDLRCGNCGASVDLGQMADSRAHRKTTDRPYDRIPATKTEIEASPDLNPGTIKETP